MSMQTKTIPSAYREFNQIYEKAKQLAMEKALAKDGNPKPPPQQFTPRGKPKPLDQQFQSVGIWLRWMEAVERELDLEPVSEVGRRIVRQPASNIRDVVIKLMVLCHMMPDEQDIGNAFAELFGSENRRGAIKALNALIERQPKGVQTFVTIRDELARFRYPNEKPLDQTLRSGGGVGSMHL